MATYYLSPDEYLAVERKAQRKSEYIDGAMYARAGASEPHNLIVGNLITELNIQLRAVDCKVYLSDLKVQVPDSSKFFYPDVSVVCGETQYTDGERDVILNPILIVEVLSDSTAAFDRGKKFQSYQQIETLREYLLVAQDEMVVEDYVRQDDGHWLYTRVSGLDASIFLPGIKCQVRLSDIYLKTT